MDEIRYSILFDGVIMAGAPDETAVASLAKLLDWDVSEVARLFAGYETVTLISGLTSQDADRLIHLLRHVGVMARKAQDVAKHTTLLRDTPELALTEEPALDYPTRDAVPIWSNVRPLPASPLDSPDDFWSRSSPPRQKAKQEG